MRKIFLTLIFFASLAALPLHAQNITSVSATVVDPNGIPYANAQVQFQLVNASGQVSFTASPTLAGAQFPTYIVTNLNAAGVLSINLPSNAVILPASTLWLPTVCPNPNAPLPAGTGSGCFATAGISISGASQDISSTLNASSLALTKPSLTLAGSCGGVGTASSTLFLEGLGQVTASTCTVTTGPAAFVSPRAGTLRDLNCTATAGGVNASSGAVTIQTAPPSTGTMASTTITATFGTGTTASDTTHTAAVVAGTQIRVQFTTQAAETLAGVVCTASIT